jgi:hypothetical protein
MKDNLPEITHLQFLVLSLVTTNPIKGKDLREALKKAGVRKSGPGFYQLMSRLEEARMVEGWYEAFVIEGVPIKERTYKLLGRGHSAWNTARDFYETWSEGKAVHA